MNDLRERGNLTDADRAWVAQRTEYRTDDNGEYTVTTVTADDTARLDRRIDALQAEFVRLVDVVQVLRLLVEGEPCGDLVADVDAVNHARAMLTRGLREISARMGAG
jgi:hypothetical protein